MEIIILLNNNTVTLSSEKLNKSKVLQNLVTCSNNSVLDLNGIRDIQPFINYVLHVKGNEKYKDFELANYLDAPEYFNYLLTLLTVDNEPIIEEIEKLNYDVMYEIYLNLPLSSVPYPYNTFTSQEGEKFLQKWFTINKEKLTRCENGKYKLTVLFPENKKREYGLIDNYGDEGLMFKKWFEYNYIDDVRQGRQDIWHSNRHNSWNEVPTKKKLEDCEDDEDYSPMKRNIYLFLY